MKLKSINFLAAASACIFLASSPLFIAAAAEPEKPQAAVLEPINGKVSELSFSDGTVTIQTEWNRPFEGRVWVAFTQERALYASELLDTDTSQRKQTYALPLPKNVPAGKISVLCVPMINEAVTSIPDGFVEIPTSLAAQSPRASAWGIYRDSEDFVHPWYVNEGNMMFWDGEPYIPMGGMINTQLTWGTSPGTSSARKGAVDKLRNQFIKLRELGIRDVFFNGTFLTSNPETLRTMVELSEEYGMHYGIHPSTSLSRTDPGFRLFHDTLNVKNDSDEFSVTAWIPENQALLDPEFGWVALDASGQIIGHGNGIAKELDAQAREAAEAKLLKENPKANRRSALTYYNLPISLSKNSGSDELTVHYYLKCEFSGPDAFGYIESYKEHIARYRELFGTLPFGSGMRMWIDPSQNEMHANFLQMNATETWHNRVIVELVKRYSTIEKLRIAWGNTKEPLIDSFQTASRLVPMGKTDDELIWMEPNTGAVYSFSINREQSLNDIREFAGIMSEEALSELADGLKSIADVPVILKHNTWFSDWFINSRPAGGMDGMGYETYCYGDSVAYHNSLVPYAQVLQAGRNQWALTTESSAAAFEGQKDYVGYMDRLQLIDSIDQLMLYGSKGFYHFGFAFTGNSHYDTTDLMKDIRQVEWLATQSIAYNEAAERLADYRPEVYGWFPASLRSNTILGERPDTYEMDGNYTGIPTQIRQAPDGRWIIPAVTADAPWFGMLAADSLMDFYQADELAEVSATKEYPVYFLTEAESEQAPLYPNGVPRDWKQAELNGFTSQGVGVISPDPKSMTLDEFQQEVLGYRVFQTESINGRTTHDGDLLVWASDLRQVAEVLLPMSATVKDIEGNPVTTEIKDGKQLLILKVPGREVITEGTMPYIAWGKYYYKDLGQPEVAYISGVDVDDLLALNSLARNRWLPAGVDPVQVKLWQEAEDFKQTTFTQPRLEGLARYSNRVGIGINTYYNPPTGENYSATYEIETSAIESPSFWLRRMEQYSSFYRIRIKIDGQLIGEPGEITDVMHLNPWSAALGRNNLNVGWTRVAVPDLRPGKHIVEILVTADGGRNVEDNLDFALLGPGAKDAVDWSNMRDYLQYLQLDAWMLTAE